MRILAFLAVFLFSTAAWANALLPAIMASYQAPGGGGGATCLQGYAGLNMVGEWDATNSSSYSGSGTTFANLVGSPADGSGQTAYDLDINGGMTFTGSAGDAAAYFATDATDDDFTLAGALTTFIKEMHKTEDWWFAMALMYDADEAGNQGVVSTQASASAGATVYFRAADYPRATPPNNNFTSNTLSDLTNEIVIVTYDHATTTIAAKTARTSIATNTSYTFTDNTSDGTAFSVGSYQGGTGYMGDEARIYAFALGNTYIGTSEMAQIVGCWETDHSRDYDGL